MEEYIVFQVVQVEVTERIYAKDFVDRVAAQKNIRILVVEDDRDMRELYCETLGILDLVPETAKNAVEALHTLAHGTPPDAVILDLSVPGMPAQEFHTKIRNILNPAQTKLIVISGADSLAAKARELGAWKYLLKPFDLSELLDTVKELL